MKIGRYKWLEPDGRVRPLKRLTTPVLTNKLVVLWNTVKGPNVHPYKTSQCIQRVNKTPKMIEDMFEEVSKRKDLERFQKKQLRRIRKLLEREKYED